MDMVGFGVAITLADMFTPKLKEAAKGVDNFDAKLAGMSTASLAFGRKLTEGLMEYHKAFSEVAQKQGDLMSLSIDMEGMELITQKGLEFANTWSGVVVKDFTGAAYDIKSGISSLTDEGVGEMTRYALLTGKATKSTTETMSKLFALGHGIFRGHFDDDFDFGKKFSASIAATVQLFRTDGEDLSRGISNVGATAEKFGVSLAQELAVLGMSKSAFDTAAEGATSYKSFLMNATKAQKELGMTFTDSNGKLLPMVEILEKIKDRFGDLDAAEIGKLKEAFGSDEAVKIITALIDKTDDLRSSEEKLIQAQKEGLEYTQKMAKAREYGQSIVLLTEQMDSLAYTFGELLNPAMEVFADWVGEGVMWIQDFTREHKALGEALATGLFVFATLATVLGTVGIAFAGLKFALAGLGIGLAALGSMTIIITGLAVAAWALYENWDLVVTYWSGAWNDFVQEHAILADTLINVWEITFAAFETAIDGWIKIFEWGMAWIRGEVSFDPGDILQAIWGGIENIFSTAIDGWIEIFKLGWAIIVDLIGWDPIDTVKEAWGEVEKYFEDLFARISKWIDSITTVGLGMSGFNLGFNASGSELAYAYAASSRAIPTSYIPNTGNTTSHVQITHGDNHFHISGENPEATARRVVEMLAAEEQSKKDRSYY